MRTRLGYNIIGVVILVLGLCGSLAVSMWVARLSQNAVLPYLVFFGLGGLSVMASLAPRVADQWEKVIFLRLGRYAGLRGPGLFWIIPLIDRVPLWVDLRVRTTGFAAEKTLTKDTVPINVDAVLFWIVTDAVKAALEVADYEEAVAWAAQTALRDILGRTELANILVGRESIDHELRKLIDERTHDWGVSVRSVEIRDVVIPPDLEDAMSRQAQAERERQARVLLGDAEVEIAAKFEMASTFYQRNPVALQLRSMNILYEGLKEKGSLMVIPSQMAGSMAEIGGFAGLAAAMKEERRGNGE
jgi:regulator of protease activity HflC (stomatin/prohibitin superfamily)